MDPAELAELVAMASDLTDATDSESETEKLRSNEVEDSSTLTSTCDSLSVRVKFKTSESLYKSFLSSHVLVKREQELHES